MKKMSWIFTVIGFITIISSALYPLDVISKQAFLALLIGGAGVMFVGSMIRSFSILKK
ncbi:hypothetical protein ACH0BF_08970 [Pseudobacillus sp. 179-B 2D1 NHS]|uniref:hypothetical protein n=1 Tax=Pseudobacillus sp. 179-B 2D1 NHS TaxID=3374292 RepID=UPI003879673B